MGNNNNNKLTKSTKLAQKGVSGILSSISSDLVQYIPQVCDVVKNVGCKDQAALVRSLDIIWPEFSKYSTQVASKLFEFVQIAELSNAKHHEYVLSQIFEDTTASLNEKVEYVRKLEQDKAKETQRLVATIGFIAAVPVVAVAMTTVAPKVSSDVKGILKTKYIADTVRDFSLKAAIEAIKG